LGQVVLPCLSLGGLYDTPHRRPAGPSLLILRDTKQSRGSCALRQSSDPPRYLLSTWRERVRETTDRPPMPCARPVTEGVVPELRPSVFLRAVKRKPRATVFNFAWLMAPRGGSDARAVELPISIRGRRPSWTVGRRRPRLCARAS